MHDVRCTDGRGGRWLKSRGRNVWIKKTPEEFARFRPASLGLFATARVSSALDVGDKAPEFTLPATTGEKISLSQFRGNKIVLLEFYGADYSPV